MPPCKHNPDVPKQTTLNQVSDRSYYNRSVEHVITEQNQNYIKDQLRKQDSLFEVDHHRSSYNHTNDLQTSGHLESSRSPFVPPKNLHQSSIAYENHQSQTEVDKQLMLPSEIDARRLHNISTDHNLSFTNPKLELNSSSAFKPSRMNKFHHYQKMAEMQNRTWQNQNLSIEVSPYSILRSSNQNDISKTIQEITGGMGARSTRAQLLKQLALKQKLVRGDHNGPSRISRQDGLSANKDDQTSSLEPLRGRIRNKRGEYQTILTSGSIGGQRMQSQTADPMTQRSRVSEMNKAENRLKIIEKISKYRE